MHLEPWLVCSSFLLLLQAVVGLDKQLTCGVCRAIVDEVHYSISLVDPKKTVQVGSFRVDSKGNQKTHEKPYARSEIHLIETLEKVCENFRDYAETTNDAGQKTVVRTKSRHGGTLNLKSINISAEKQKLLKFKCEHLIEDYEEDMIPIFRKEGMPEEKVEKIICGEIADVCTSAELSVPLPVAEVDNIDKVEPVNVAEEETEESDQSLPSNEELFEEYLKDSVQEGQTDTDSNKDEL